jgi:DNA-binding CsgD family transcriptional regulator
MITRNNTLLIRQLPANWMPPESFFENIFLQDNVYCFFFTCNSRRDYYEMGTSCEKLTGFTADEFDQGGIEFWLSRVHPDDINLVTDTIIEGFSQLAGIRGHYGSPVLVPMRYRFLSANGTWLNLIDTRYLFSREDDGKVHQILCKIESVEDTRDEIRALRIISEKDPTRNKMLLAALLVKEKEDKAPKNKNNAVDFNNKKPLRQPSLTNREKEVLQMISDGLSTKMIADRCFISVHTVESHRKHLLEKLEVKNSMELVKKASKYFLLQ